MFRCHNFFLMYTERISTCFKVLYSAKIVQLTNAKSLVVHINQVQEYYIVMSINHYKAMRLGLYRNTK